MTEEIWHTKTWKEPKDSGVWQGAIGGMVWPGRYAEELLGKINYSELFVYMYRRFGPSEFGSDYHKEVVCWYLTTPDENAVLVVTPRPSIKCSFGYHVNDRVYYDHRNIVQTTALNAALKSAMLDLLVPTNIRDVFINAAGRVKDEDIPEETVEYFKWAGCGVVREYFEYRYGEDERRNDD